MHSGIVAENIDRVCLGSHCSLLRLLTLTAAFDARRANLLAREAAHEEAVAIQQQQLAAQTDEMRQVYMMITVCVCDTHTHVCS